ncbi:MAG: DegV family protein [Lachnospiraceae bacterium]
MSYAIVGDSCCDFTIEDIQERNYIQVPLTLYANGKEFPDDQTFDRVEFLKNVKEATDVPRSACPDPSSYMEAYKHGDEVYVVTLSAKLSGSYNSACLAKELYEEEYGDKKIHIFDSKSAACGQHNVVRKIAEYADAGLPFEEVVEKVEAYISEMDTIFVLETLEVLEKNGRIPKSVAMVMNKLNIKLIMGAEDGTIVRKNQARGVKKALTKMVDMIQDSVSSPETKVLSITECLSLERAEMVKQMIAERMNFKEIQILPSHGVSSLYACEGGIVVAY